MIPFLSVCSGIEAASVAWAPLGWHACLVSEIERFPREVLAYRFGAAPVEHARPSNALPLWGDFTALRVRHLRRLGIVLPRLLVGGTPCQDFSIAGARASLDGARGNLSLDFVRLAHALGNAHVRSGSDGSFWAVWENVPGVLSTRDNAFGRFVGALVGGGDAIVSPLPGGRWPRAGMASGRRARAAWRVLDAQHFGLAQRRERVFLVASLGGGGDPAAVLFEPARMPGHPAPRLAARKGAAGRSVRGAGAGGIWRQVARALFGGGPAGEARSRGVSEEVSQTQRAMRPNAVAGTLEATYGEQAGNSLRPDLLVAFGGARTSGSLDVATAVRAKGGSGHMDFESETFVAHTLRGEGFDASEDGTGRGTPIVPIPFDTTQITSPENGSQPQAGGPCHTLLAGAHPPAIAAYGVRRLMPTECERLQGLPDNFTLLPGQRADGPRYKAIGNSKAVPVVRWVGERICAVDPTMRSYVEEAAE